MTAEQLAQEFNKRNPRHKVAFVACYVLELLERIGRPCCCVEPLLEGRYHKHNNNDGHVGSDRDTPQAFSHFTYEHSKRKLLVCDIQGVADFYTDPQIHSVDAKGFGLGNLGKDGIAKFLMTHKCRDECRRIGLVPSKSIPLPSNPNARFSNGQWGVGAALVAGTAAPRAGVGVKGPSTKLAEHMQREENIKWNDIDQRLAR
eukprot:CAMPEP_0114320800 /NCGR_PEP_ID=MMETSP0059-20121206/26167_1 /TAXON_ID=36894 /ORGANISM="Pyramimonas parkeae, Strain CCMP726" /LENGTH=201 /DNA_ID=CAMNT_0001448297 /DNA_START=324 /DNA_END=927 /DNA_ORIENTATION=+